MSFATCRNFTAWSGISWPLGRFQSLGVPRVFPENVGARGQRYKSSIDAVCTYTDRRMAGFGGGREIVLDLFGHLATDPRCSVTSALVWGDARVERPLRVGNPSWRMSHRTLANDGYIWVKPGHPRP